MITLIAALVTVASLTATEFAPPPPVPTRVDVAALARPRRPAVAPEQVLAARWDWDRPPLTEVVPHNGGFAVLRRSGPGWVLLTSRDGFTWEAAKITGPFAGPDARLVLTGDGAALTAAEADDRIVLWRSADGLNWRRTEVALPWPTGDGLRYLVHGASFAGGLLTVSGQAVADWPALLGVDAALLDDQRDASLQATVASGPQAGTYALRLVATAGRVELRVVDAADAGRVVATRTVEGIDDAEWFVDTFIACGGFTPMSHSWLLASDGTLASPPWLSSLGPGVHIVTSGDVTAALDEYDRVRLLEPDGDWSDPLPRPPGVAAVQALVPAADGLVAVGAAVADGRRWPVSWRAGDDRATTARVALSSDAWPVAAGPWDDGAVMVVLVDDAGVVPVVLGSDGRARGHRLALPGGLWWATWSNGTLLVQTVDGEDDMRLWAWRVEVPSPRSVAVA